MTQESATSLINQQYQNEINQHNLKIDMLKKQFDAEQKRHKKSIEELNQQIEDCLNLEAGTPDFINFLCLRIESEVKKIFGVEN